MKSAVHFSEHGCHLNLCYYFGICHSRGLLCAIPLPIYSLSIQKHVHTTNSNLHTCDLGVYFHRQPSGRFFILTSLSLSHFHTLPGSHGGSRRGVYCLFFE